MSELPRHVAIIMDGNGRWAQARHLSRIDGHQAGANTVRRVTTRARELGIESLTLYAFSTENWRRPKDEVRGLWKLLVDYLRSELPTLLKNQIRLKLIGDPGAIPKLAQNRLNSVIERTAGSSAMTLNLALNYGAQSELVHAFKQIQRQGETIDAEQIERHLYTAGQPAVDLLIRTGGERRLSNFLLWQAAYAELYFCDTLWPDFSDEHFDQALNDFRQRERRFGQTSAQLSQRAAP
ncbi:MAG: polyprenyl diphosphate synthase [Myxococcota bacterium]|nr:polyprenyl diphosphate synthase [Myxococcota bacterium]